MSEYPEQPQIPDLSLPQEVCLKAMLGLIDGRNYLDAECPLRRSGYPEASIEVFGNEPIALDCAKSSCDKSAVLQIEDGKVTVAISYL